MSSSETGEGSLAQQRLRFGRQLIHRALFWLRYQNWPAGKWVEITGNQGRVGGLAFDLANPYIKTFLKGRFLMGSYEPGAERLVAAFVDPALPVIEFGGCIGVISCLTHRRLAEPRDHLVVEAHPFLIETLRANRGLNGCDFEILHAALAYEGLTIPFWLSPDYFIGSSTRPAAGRQAVTVPATTLGTLIATRDPERITLIVDVEGAETELIEREVDLMARVVDTLIVEFHPAAWGAGPEAVARARARLAEAGFIEVDRVGSDFVYRNRRWHPVTHP